MKPIKLSTIIFCLFLIGLSPQSVKPPGRQTQPSLISGVVTTNIGFSQPDNSLLIHLDTVALNKGKAFFERNCGRCHSTGFVTKSGITSVLADSLVTVMADKAGFQFDPAQHSMLVQYLRFILPRK